VLICKSSYKTRIRFLAFMMLGLLAAASCDAESTVNRPAEAVAEKQELIRVTVYQLVVDPSSRQPVVALSDAEEKRALFIWIGLAEARAIYSEIEGVEHPRPLTHDLLEKIIQESNGTIHHIVITHSRDNIYYAIIVLQREEKRVEIDARPSDALVMALKFNAPIYVSRDLFAEVSLPLESRTDMEESYGISLQELTPDLAKYLAFKSEKGVMVSGVRKGSPAALDGLIAGDIIVEVDGRVVEGLPFFRQIFKKSKSPLKAKIFRNNQFLTLTVHPG
jgi:bifunctional DNase/RNase